jgi:hypothetical protein
MTRKIFVVAITLLGASVLPVTAQVRLEMTRITCKQWLDGAWDQQNFMQYWMSGYYNSSRNNSELDFSRLKRNTAKVTAYCKKHRSETLASAIQKNAN